MMAMRMITYTTMIKMCMMLMSGVATGVSTAEAMWMGDVGEEDSGVHGGTCDVGLGRGYFGGSFERRDTAAKFLSNVVIQM